MYLLSSRDYDLFHMKACFLYGDVRDTKTLSSLEFLKNKVMENNFKNGIFEERTYEPKSSIQGMEGYSL